MSTWVEHAVFWHVYPLGAVGAEPVLADDQPVRHRLGRLTGWLDHAVALGASGILLGPVFTAHSHGYDTIDYYSVDPRLGDRGDLDALVAAAHERGLRVVLDGVFNHVGSRHPLFLAAAGGGPQAPESALFHLTWRTGDDGSPVLADYVTFEGHTGLVALDHDSPAVVDLVTDVMRHWLRAGVDGWRLDAAYAVPPAFWAKVLPGLRAEFPEMYVVGEVIHGDYPQIVTESGMDAVTQYELWKAIWSALADRNFYELAHALGRHDELLETFVPMTFVGNHDVTRIASQMSDPRHLAHAVVVLLTVAGTPSVYYGDELGLTGVKEERLGGDDAIRPELPEPPQLPDGADTEVLGLHRELIGLRRRHPWLHRARTSVVQLSNEVLAYEVTGDGGRLVVALSTADDATAVDVVADEVLAGHAEPGDGWVLPPHGWAVLATRR